MPFLQPSLFVVESDSLRTLAISVSHLIASQSRAAKQATRKEFCSQIRVIEVGHPSGVLHINTQYPSMIPASGVERTVAAARQDEFRAAVFL